MFRKNNLISAIDIGSSSIKGLVVSKKQETGRLEALSQISVPSQGVRRGVVSDPELVAEAINEVVTKMRAEIRPQNFRSIQVGISGTHIFAKNGHGAVAISRADQKVSQDDIERVKEEAKNVNLSFNQEILDIFPKEFSVDKEVGLKDVLGMKGIKLEVEAIAICGLSHYIQKSVDALLGAGLEMSEMIVSPLAGARAVLTPQQMDLGVALVDIGAQTTGIAVFEEKSLIHLAFLPVGSANISRDIAIALQADIDIAEQIKLKFGSYIFKNKTKKEKIALDKESFFTFDTKKMVRAGKARVVEILSLVNKELKKINRQGGLPAGIVLTGGGAKLPGIIDFTKKQLGLPVKLGVPTTIVGLEEDPSLSVVAGLVTPYSTEKIGEGSDNSRGIKILLEKLISIFKP